MATIEQLREKLKQVNARRGGGGNKSKWFAKDRHLIRLLPIQGADEPYRIVFFHYLNKKPVYCPHMNDGEQCDVCELAAALKEWDDDKSEADRKRDFKAGCNLEASPKYYFSVVEKTVGDDRKVTLSAPQWWSMGEPLWKDMVNIALKDDNVEAHEQAGGDVTNAWDVLTNTKHAYDIEVDLRAADNKDGKGNLKQFSQTVLTDKKTQTALSKDAEEVKKILASVPDFSTVEVKLSSSDVTRLFNEYLNVKAPEAKSDDDGTEKSGEESHNSEKPAAGKLSIEDALNNMTGD